MLFACLVKAHIMTKALELQIPKKLMPFITKKKRYKVAFGGRGGAKSMSIAGMLAHKAQVESAL